MANYCGSARSNYFAVKDDGEFREAMAALPGIEVHEDQDGGRVCLLEAEGVGWPYSLFDDDGNEEVDVDLPGIVAGHLTKNEVAVFMETGAEKLRYLVGVATAINSECERRTISLQDIYGLADELGDNITACEY